jgi:hypothetical protein
VQYILLATSEFRVFDIDQRELKWNRAPEKSVIIILTITEKIFSSLRINEGTARSLKLS